MKRIYILFGVIFLFVQCITEPNLEVLFITNKSTQIIKIYFNSEVNHRFVYPDTLITNFQNRVYFENYLPFSERNEIISVASWRETYKNKASQDTLYLFIFASDTLAKYSWEEIRKGYKVLARYDLSLEDLERLNFELSYPPDNRMQGIKMYPR